MPGGTLSNAPQEIAGNQVPSAGWNTMATDLSLLSQPPCCRLNISGPPVLPGGQPMTAGQLNANPSSGSLYAFIPWTKVSDPWGMFGSTLYDIVIPTGWGGTYDVDVAVAWTSGFLPNDSLSGSTFTLAATVRTDILLNGTSLAYNLNSCSNFFVPTTCNVSTSYPMGAGAKVAVVVGQTGGPSNATLGWASISVNWRSQ